VVTHSHRDQAAASTTDQPEQALLNGIAPPRPLPDPLPVPPEIPLSYLSEISQQIYAESLTKDQQLAIVAKLQKAITDEDNYDTAMQLAQLLEKRDDLYFVVGQPLRVILNTPRPRGSTRYVTTMTRKPSSTLNVTQGASLGRLPKVLLAVGLPVTIAGIILANILANKLLPFGISLIDFIMTLAGVALIALGAEVIRLVPDSGLTWTLLTFNAIAFAFGFWLFYPDIKFWQLHHYSTEIGAAIMFGSVAIVLIAHARRSSYR
jgi:hypothetical protein